ncbi:MAG: hypothetical protein E4G90_07615 [Gemmatimonadales bacterium]|nr:MAG: hypothetical protein E4G90_07615 [Gemmatimonadales bacterium]
MTAASFALLLGLFGVPGLLMALGHRLRRRSEGHKLRFWGGVTGYILGMSVAISAMLLPPVWWADGTFLRPFLVHWAMVLGGILGLLTGPYWARTPGGPR